jgi:DNA polymerase
MAIKNLKKHFNDGLRQYYHSTGVYDSLIYREMSANLCLSQDQKIATLIKKIEKNYNKFYLHKNNIQFSNNKINSKIMIIGDFPSLDDKKNNSIFSDESGVLLNKMLSAISLSIDNVYLTNIVHFYLEENKQEYLNQKSLLKKFTQEHIEIIKPKIIFLLGSLPLEILFENQYSLIKNRGQWIQYKRKDYSAEVIASFHPNFLIKQPNQKKNSWKDLQILQQKIVEFNI